MRLQTRKRLVEELEDSIMQGSGQQRRLNQFGLKALEFLYRTPRKSGFRSRSAILQSKNSQGLLFTSYESKHDIRARHARQKKSLLKAEPIMKLRNQQPIPYFTQLARVLTYNNQKENKESQQIYQPGLQIEPIDPQLSFQQYRQDIQAMENEEDKENMLGEEQNWGRSLQGQHCQYCCFEECDCGGSKLLPRLKEECSVIEEMTEPSKTVSEASFKHDLIIPMKHKFETSYWLRNKKYQPFKLGPLTRSKAKMTDLSLKDR